MRTPSTWGCLFACLLLCGCPPHDPSQAAEDASAPDTGVDAGPCPEGASLYGVDIHDQPQPLANGSTLPITLGFQGFQFVRVGIRTQRALSPMINFTSRITVAGVLDVTTAFQGVATSSTAGGGSETTDVNVMFNDAPLAQILGQHATLRIWTAAPGCALDATVDVVLVQGNFQGPDGGTFDAADGD